MDHTHVLTHVGQALGWRFVKVVKVGKEASNDLCNSYRVHAHNNRSINPTIADVIILAVVTD